MNASISPTVDLDRLARKRAAAKMGWYTHAMIYVAINLGLAVLSLGQGRSWVVFPALGWGLGLLVHGIAVWVLVPGGGLMERLVARERARLDASRQGRG